MSEHVSGWVYSAVNIVAHGACVCVCLTPHAPQARPVFDIKGYGSHRVVIVTIIHDLEVWDRQVLLAVQLFHAYLLRIDVVNFS